MVTLFDKIDIQCTCIIYVQPKLNTSNISTFQYGGIKTNILITIEFHLLNDALVAHVIPHPMVSTLY